MGSRLAVDVSHRGACTEDEGYFGSSPMNPQLLHRTLHCRARTSLVRGLPQHALAGHRA